MKTFHCLVIVFLFGVKVKTGHTQESCTSNNFTMVCKNIIDTFPNIFYGNYEDLVCENCSIGTFSESTFPYSNRLRSFNASASGIERVSEKAFSLITETVFIDLRNNSIKNISSGAFLGSREIRILYLDDNKLESLTPKFLDDFEVNTVSLTRNKLTKLSAFTFHGVLSLLTLDLSNNLLAEIDRDAFENVNTLEVLDLQNNKLCSLPFGVFRSLYELRFLYLSNNKFTRFGIGVFSGLVGLHYLNLANNSLNEFDSNFLITMPRLSELDIGGNGIYYLDAYQVHLNGPAVKSLQVGDNIFSCSVLMNVARYFRSVGAEIHQQNGRYDVQNVNGVACTDTEIAQVIPLELFYKTVEKDAERMQIYC